MTVIFLHHQRCIFCWNTRLKRIVLHFFKCLMSKYTYDFFFCLKDYLFVLFFLFLFIYNIHFYYVHFCLIYELMTRSIWLRIFYHQTIDWSIGPCCDIDDCHGYMQEIQTMTNLKTRNNVSKIIIILV